MVVAMADVRPTGRARVSGPTGIPALSDRLVESRVRVLEDFAERFAEFVDPQSGPSGVRGDGGGVGLSRHEPRCLLLERPPEVRRDLARARLPHCTCDYRSVTEFGRLVSRLRSEERLLWWHLDGWWLSAEKRTVWHCPRCGICHQPSHDHQSRKNAGKVVQVRCKRVIVWSRRVGAVDPETHKPRMPRESLAKQALEWIAQEWALDSEPMLPHELRVVA